jgi:hypothetical protein
MYKVPLIKLKIYEQSFFPYSINLWNNLPNEVKELESLFSLKTFLNPKNNRVALYYYGARWANVQQAKLRMKISNLNADLCYHLHVRSDPGCACGWQTENVEHYLCECPLYLQQRSNLIRKLQMLGHGLVLGKPDVNLLLQGDISIPTCTNELMFDSLHEFIRTSKRLK